MPSAGQSRLFGHMREFCLPDQRSIGEEPCWLVRGWVRCECPLDPFGIVGIIVLGHAVHWSRIRNCAMDPRDMVLRERENAASHSMIQN